MIRRCDDCGAEVADAIGARQCSLFDPPDTRIDPTAAAGIRSGRILCPACARGVPLLPEETSEAVAIDLADGEADAADDGPDEACDDRHPLDTLPDAPPGYISRQIAGETIGMSWRHGSHVYVRPPCGPVDHGSPWVEGFRDAAISGKPYHSRRGRNAEPYRNGYNDGRAWRIGMRIGECFRDASTAGDLRGSVARVQLLDVLGGQAHERKDHDRASQLWRLAEDLDQGR